MSVTLASFNPLLVGLSFLISVLGSFAALRLASAIPHQDRQDRLPWVLAAAFALGAGGIWSMHFIGMLAFDMGMPVSYDIPLTVLSMVLGWSVSAVGIYIASRFSGWLPLVLAGVIMGSGVATMHYTGMAAMKMNAEISYNQTLLVLSIVIALVAATAALWLAFNVRSQIQMVVASVVMGIAVTGMHYVGMFAAEFTPLPGVSAGTVMPLASDFIAYSIFVLSVLVLGLGLVFGRTGEVESLAA